MATSAVIGLYIEDLNSVDLTVIWMDGYKEKAGKKLATKYKDKFDVADLFELAGNGIRVLGDDADSTEYGNAKVAKSYRAESLNSAFERAKQYSDRHRASLIYIFDNDNEQWMTLSRSGEPIKLTA